MTHSFFSRTFFFLNAGQFPNTPFLSFPFFETWLQYVGLAILNFHFIDQAGSDSAPPACLWSTEIKVCATIAQPTWAFPSHLWILRNLKYLLPPTEGHAQLHFSKAGGISVLDKPDRVHVIDFLLLGKVSVHGFILFMVELFLQSQV